MALHAALLRSGAAIEMVAPHAGLPDLVFTANAAVVLDGKALLARFRHPERQGEQPVFAARFRALQARGLIDEVIEMPRDVALEGAGDCLWDARAGLFWMGCGFRSDAAAARVVEEMFGVAVRRARARRPELLSPRYRDVRAAVRRGHLSSGRVHARGARARSTIASRRTDRIALNAGRRRAIRRERDLRRPTDHRFVELQRRFARARWKRAAIGGRKRRSPRSSARGGSACCLTLRLDHVAQAQVAAPRLAAAG